MAPGMRRLIADHASLHNDLPPNYLFPPADPFSSLPDDLTQLTILLTGPQGTPYAHGLWRLHLRIPEDYPRSPPKASFKTRIWHPNVEESSGAVCVDTLKRDWECKLTLRDVLVTISCLLIQPNPDSALNSAAGALLQDDYDAFARQAKLMTSIHAPIPQDLKDAVMEAKWRGEEAGVTMHPAEEQIPSKIRKTSTTSASVVMKKPVPQDQTVQMVENADADQEDEEIFDEENESKENDPSLSPSPVTIASPSPRRLAVGKRPLSVLAAAPMDDEGCDTEMDEAEEEGFQGLTDSERNIAANVNFETPNQQQQQSERKFPRLSPLVRGPFSSPRSSFSPAPQESQMVMPTPMLQPQPQSLHHDQPSGPSPPGPGPGPLIFEDGSPNSDSSGRTSANLVAANQDQKPQTWQRRGAPLTLSSNHSKNRVAKPQAGGLRKPGLASSGTGTGGTRPKTKPRIGLRRL